MNKLNTRYQLNCGHILKIGKGYKYFEIERDFFNKLGVLIDGDFKFGVLLLVFVRFLGGDTGNLYRNGFL
jgi:hypothetical protein